MKSNISIITWINRILMAPFVISLLVAIIDLQFLSLAALIAFFLGPFQLISFLIILSYLNSIDDFRRKIILVYISIVLLYISSYYLLKENHSPIIRTTFFQIIYIVIPIALSLLWTYILESLKKQI